MASFLTLCSAFPGVGWGEGKGFITVSLTSCIGGLRLGLSSKLELVLKGL